MSNQIDQGHYDQLLIDYYFMGAASCVHVGRTEINPTQGKLLWYPSFLDTIFYDHFANLSFGRD
jgi:hypothetical protein